MNDLTPVEIEQAGENLASKISKGRLARDVDPLEGALIHVLEQDLDFAVVVVHVVAPNHVGVIDVAEDLDLAADLEADGVIMVAVDDLEGVVFAGGPVEDFVDGAAAAAADAVDSLQLGEV